jgi:hypothetical protein
MVHAGNQVVVGRSIGCPAKQTHFRLPCLDGGEPPANNTNPLG